MKITLIGAHGKVALIAQPLLVQAGHEVRSVVRNPDHTADIELTGAQPVVTDIERLDADGWDELLRGSEAVVWTAGAGGGDARRTYAVDRDAAIASMDAAQRVGAERYVMVSYFGAGPEHGVPEDDDFFAYADAKSAADEHLQNSGLAWTVLRPSALTLEEPTGRIDANASEGTEVSRANVARVIAAALEHESTSGAVIEFNDGDQLIDEALQSLD
ncbi:SDR family oxidoreductase [Brachybacterium muris]|uniref:SDR family oxidoreductase n=1 Tax=Brachybacterium muris TaxID=219301 RepID=UPI00223AA144|nr:SDR family oxidoreductase [Brachybacterium muris]MCT1997821.1 SDR family oxidoreductase [Brachybacterium muris]MCT2177924.1 SDR family oxidoreductase [Brachybacterium muris]